MNSKQWKLAFSYLRSRQTEDDILGNFKVAQFLFGPSIIVTILHLTLFTLKIFFRWLRRSPPTKFTRKYFQRREIEMNFDSPKKFLASIRTTTEFLNRLFGSNFLLCRCLRVKRGCKVEGCLELTPMYPE